MSDFITADPSDFADPDIDQEELMAMLDGKDINDMLKQSLVDADFYNGN